MCTPDHPHALIPGGESGAGRAGSAGPCASDRTSWYLSAMERLLRVVQDLSQARDVNAITAIVRDAARALTGADGAAFVLRDGDQCYYAEENAIAPLWKGRRFPMCACISGWAMLHGRAAVIEDIYADTRIPADAYRPTFVKSLAMVPIRRAAPIGAIGNYWATRRLPTDEEVAILQALADTTSVALESAELFERLRHQVRTLQEQQATIQEQRDALEVFTRALAHDLKEPVRTMTSFARMIPRDGLTEDARSHIHFVQSAADRMGLLIDSIFRYVQLDAAERAERSPVALRDVLREVRENLSPMIRGGGVTIEADALPVVHASREQMTQVLQILIANAIVHNEGAITVRVGAEERAGQWWVSVRDNGRGIPPEHAEKVFLPFKRLTHKEGCAGLGLAICRKIISLHGGTIRCESRPGQGASFVFSIPAPAHAETGAEGPSAAASIPANDHGAQPLARFLLVDDRPDDLQLTKILLAKKGGLQCDFLTARDGAEALAILRREPIDLVLLDINMPGMDGFELLERMRVDSTLERIPVIMCTGSTYEEDQRRARELGATGYLVKPPSFDKLKPMLDLIPSLRLRPQEKGHRLVRAESGTDAAATSRWAS